jgi:hypothetical protein
LIWKTGHKKCSITEISTEILDKKANPIGEKKFFNLPNDTFLNEWIERPKINGSKVIPLKNAIIPATAKPSIINWAENAIAYLHCA